MATMKDVAHLAGVSITTVSHLLNNTRPVGDEARARIEQAIRELSYVPSAVARSLKHNVTHTVGMMLPNSSNPYFSELMRVIEARCFDAGYNVILCNSDDNPAKQSTYLRVLTERRVDGLIVVTSGEDVGLHALLSELSLPVILVDREINRVQYDLVEVDHVQGGYLATQHLLSLGHQNIACIGGPVALSSSDQRIAGWRRAMVEWGINPTDVDLQRGDFTSRGGYQAMHALLKQAQCPSAVFACNDLMAIGAMCAAYELGIRVPDQLSIVGFDGISLASFSSPPLTTVIQPKEIIGAMAVDMLIEGIRGRRAEPLCVVLQPELCIRSSTAPYAATVGLPRHFQSNQS
ncbi:LacI family DNA-binding transcriptional regulator [Chitinimonas sp. BJB300]|uniref:LacI family DNA-binding transcriptional regulator n=1 Tax=Chitinimonas sp. BJB300 TaxID=1559339 RepID=UPI000C0ECFE0|nr:LacI family DNA-binding transcriptional regulator [Chitinimonas sp. BJB300]PHV11685.1 LacI family transcriptional regulator [Chitinimonas sp. BJB300]TSJ88584.1 LacI family transcriptional regulator [Chitinimonas sp. BJB300]